VFLIFFMSLRLVKYVRIVVYDTGQLFEIFYGYGQQASLPATPQAASYSLFLLLYVAKDSDEDKELQLLL
jgi:hypothetical protein